MNRIIVGIGIAALAFGSLPIAVSAKKDSDTTSATQSRISGMLSEIRDLRIKLNDARKEASLERKASREASREQRRGNGTSVSPTRGNSGDDDDDEDDKKEKQVRKEEQRQLRIARSLFRGMSGDDVRQLQEILAKYPELYPEGLVTGYFGPATENAVKRFQKKCGIEQIGVVGPKTLAQIARIFNQTENKLERLGADTSGLIPAFEKAASTTLQATSTAQGSKFTLCHNVKNNPVTITVAASAVFAHLAHGDTIGVCVGGGTSTTTPDTLSPVIYGVAASPSATSASVTWLTNESADSAVWYATSTPVVGAPGAAKVSDSALITSHGLSLPGLSTSTTYYYLVVSRDASGNVATSTTGAFTTGVISSDTTAPLIYSVSTIPSVNSASVMWTTNENATSRVWFAKTSDVMNDPARSAVSSDTLYSSHNATLTGLTGGTTYYFLLVSADAAGNIATSTSNLYFFTTVPLSISSVSTLPSTTTAIVSWQTNAASDSTAWYATSTPVMSAADRVSATSASSVTNHSVGLSGLATSTLYHYLVVSRDAFGNSATSSENTFTTLDN